MTEGGFLSFFPWFSPFEGGAVLAEYVRQANARFSDFGEDAEEARRLFAAHKLTMYCAAALPEGVPPSMAALASAGRGAVREVASKRAGEVSVSYASSSAAAGSAAARLADLQQTAYGLQLLSLLRLYGRAEYIP